MRVAKKNAPEGGPRQIPVEIPMAIGPYLGEIMGLIISGPPGGFILTNSGSLRIVSLYV